MATADINRVRLTKAAIFAFSFLFLFALFRYNASGIMPSWFGRAQPDAEATIFGRIALGHLETPWARGGTLGHFLDPAKGPYDQLDHQKAVYAGSAAADNWFPYTSSVGLQGLAFSLIDRLFPSTELHEGFYYSIAASLNAAIIAGLMLWIFAEFGFGAWAVTGIGIFFSPWLIVFGENLAWLIGFCFLPLVLTAWWLRQPGAFADTPRAQKQTKWFAAAYFAAIFARCVCTYEFISTVAMASWVPVLYYALRDRWKFRKFLRLTLLLFGLSVGAFFAALLVHIVMLYAGVIHDFGQAVRMLLSRGFMRIGLPVADLKSMVENTDSLSVSIGGVVDQYMRGYVSGKLSDRIWIPTYWTLSPVGFWIMPATAFLLTAIILLDRKFVPSVAAQRRRLLALAAATWAGFGCMLSWLVIARQHAFAHYHLVFALWYVPGAFFLFAFAALVGQLLWKDLPAPVRRNAPAVALILAIVFMVSRIVSAERGLAEIGEAAPVTQVHGMEIFLKDRSIIFYSPYCADIDRSKRFVISLIPAPGTDAGSIPLIGGEFQIDFDWTASAWLPLIFEGCMEKFDLPPFEVDTIAAEQADPVDLSVLWAVKAPLSALLSEKEVQPKAITDDLWVNGVARGHPYFLIANTLANQAALKVGTLLQFAKSGKRKIVAIQPVQDQIAVEVDGPALDPNGDGNPYVIEILRNDGLSNKNRLINHNATK